ncbi:MAG: methyltransferase domain-containing protein [Candidatus Aminicenantes bacterium]|nr:methyltransferase domain-containing protein [Candidatus Aminicenantes bacterium]
MNNESTFFVSSSRNPVEYFVHLLFQELSFRRECQLDDSYLQLKYEPIFFSRQGVFNHLAISAYATRLSPLLTEIRKRKSPKLLDSGSGCGSESILAALLGANVIGIDLVPFRTEYAASRIPFFQNIYHNGLSLQFLTANVISHLQHSPGYDIIWVNEAISHIHPAETFFSAAYQGLHPGGLLIIADANALNPVARRRAAHIRGGQDWYVHRQFKLLDDSSHDEVAEERLFTSRNLQFLLRQAGFKIQLLEMHGFLGSFFLPRSWQANPRLAKIMIGFQERVRKIPLIRNFGSSMTVIAEKTDTR